MNLYGFAGGDPVNFSDPFGLCPPEDRTPCTFADYARRMLKPAEMPLEVLGIVATLPLGGGMGMMGEVAIGARAATTLATVRIIGHITDGYAELGEAAGARFFRIGPKLWEAMTPAERWAENQAFLDRGIADGAEFVVARGRAIRQGSVLQKEVDYLLRHGYKWAKNNTRLVKR